jgi:tetratricopeptide (TPR) repeat protein
VLSQTTPPEQDDEKNEYLVRGLVRLNRESRAEALVEGHAARRQRLLDLRMVMADELWSARKRNAALKIYRTMAELGVEPHAQKALGRAAIYLSDNSMAGADALLVKYKDTYSDDTAELCLWRLAKSALQKKDQARATAMLTESLDAFPLGPGSGRARFWLHRLSRDRNDRDRAREYFKGMVVNNPDSLYTWQLIDHEAAALESRELLAEFHQALRNGDADSAVFHYGLLVYRGDQPSEPGAAPLSMKTLQEPYEKLEKQIASRSLLSSSSGVLTSLEKYFMIGDQTAINRELRFLPHGDAIKDDSLVALAHYSRKYGQHNLAINSLLDLLRHRGLRENLFLSPRPLMEQLFPRGFSRCVTANASANNLDPNYVYAVIKAESNFSHTAVSSAGAVGLMQLMPATAADIARGLKIDRYDLKNPCTSIQFGSRYLGWLMRFFNNNISLAIGGYNAGPGNIVKWRKDLPVDDLDYFIEFVPFSETRGYMLRTSKFFRQYTLLYGR